MKKLIADSCQPTALPKNICAHPDGYLVRVQRGGILFQAFVPCCKTATAIARGEAIARAEALKENFLAQLPENVRVHSFTPRSNTGLSGISETVCWRHGRPHDCFNVSWYERRPGRRGIARSTRVFFKWSEREAGLQRAINLRASKLSTINSQL